MPDPTNRNHIPAPAARLAIREFCAEALRRAGGASALSRTLAELGFTGQRGEDYSESTFEQWTGGTRAPSSAILIALALRFRIPLDAIVAAAEAAEGAADDLRAARTAMLAEERSA